MNAPAVKTGEVQFVSFHVGDSLYGLDIRFVKEVNTNIDITPVPLTMPHVRGLVNIRGQIVLVIDASILFAEHEHVLSPESHLVILKTALDFELLETSDQTDLRKLPDKPVSFLVDRIGDVITVPQTCIEKAPQHMNEERARFIQCIVKTDVLFMIVLDPAQFISGASIQPTVKSL